MISREAGENKVFSLARWHEADAKIRTPKEEGGSGAGNPLISESSWDGPFSRKEEREEEEEKNLLSFFSRVESTILPQFLPRQRPKRTAASKSPPSKSLFGSSPRSRQSRRHCRRRRPNIPSPFPPLSVPGLSKAAFPPDQWERRMGGADGGRGA